MWISNIKITNFRNYDKQEIKLRENINLFYGENAQGKTNIIESIFLTSIGKSFRSKKDSELIKFNEEKAIIEVSYEKKDRNGKIKIEISNKKEVYINAIKIQKLSELLGNINVVIFTPDDINIIKDGPQNRRRFLDIMISQLKPNYMYNLNLYIKTLEQRNNYLKQIKRDSKDPSLLEIWDEKLADYAEKIYKYRYEYIEKIKEKISSIHKEMTEGKEELKIKYISDYKNKEEYLQKLKEVRKTDILKGFSTIGIHRDNFSIVLNDKDVSSFGSQGQQRSSILSLKMSELRVIEEEIGESPILLLDDFMSELDSKRKSNFIESIKNTQVIITSTEELDIEKIKYFKYNVSNGKII